MNELDVLDVFLCFLLQECFSLNCSIRVNDDFTALGLLFFVFGCNESGSVLDAVRLL